MARHPPERANNFQRPMSVRANCKLQLLWRALMLAMFWSVSASADPTWLDWQAPPECPMASDIERRVSQWLGGPVPNDSDMAVRTALIWNGERWDVTVEIAFGDERGTRQVGVQDCQEAADFVAVAVALALDPSLAGEMNQGAPEPAPEASERDSTPEALATPSAVPARSPTPRARSERTQPPRGVASNAQRPFRPHASIAAEGVAGVLPDPALGLSAAVGAEFGRLSFSLGGRWTPPQSTTSERAVAPIEFSRLGGRARTAYLFFGPIARVGPSIAVDAGAIRAKQQRTGDGVVEPWLSLAAGTLGVAALTDYVSIFGELELEAPLTRPTFVLTDGSVVHKVNLGLRAALGVRFFFFGE